MSQHLTVRVQLSPSEQNNAVEYQYHWGRILLVLIPVIGLVLWTLMSIMPTQQSGDDATGPSGAIADAPSIAVTDATPTTHAADSTSTSIETAEQQSAQAQPSDTIPSTSSDTISGTTASAAPAVPKLSFQQAQTSIHDANVSRFVLAQGVNDREPSGTLANVRSDSKGIARVYAFSDVRQHKDQFLFYRWLHNGREVARVKVGVWSNRWRSHAGKYITPAQSGQWRVQLMNDKDALLAETGFTVNVE